MSITYNIIDVFGTKYFYLTYVKDMQYFISAVTAAKEGDKPHAFSAKMGELLDSISAGDEVTLDIAGAVFTSNVVSLLTQIQKTGLRVIDSKIKSRNDILEENARRLAIDVSELVPLPEYTYKTDLIAYVKSLDPNVTYNLINLHRMSEATQRALVVFITMTRPNIKIFSYDIDTLLNYVASIISSEDLLKYQQFYAVTPDGIYDLDFSNGAVDIYGYGSYTLSEAIKSFTLVPKDFGTKRLTEDPTFSNLMQVSINKLHTFAKLRPKTLSEICLGSEG